MTASVLTTTILITSNSLFTKISVPELVVYSVQVVRENSYSGIFYRVLQLLF